jgi:AcrR family transcriptional regulator
MPTKAEQSETTRRALLKVARRLFATRGYADTPIEEIVRRAKVTRGALYHHFTGKQDLFRWVLEGAEEEITERLAAVAQAEPRQELHMERGSQAFLDACMDQAIQRIVLLDAPSVLGWDVWHEIDSRHGLALVQLSLESAMAEGYYERQPVEPLAQLILGALNEAGLAIARAEDPARARKEMGAGVARLLDGLKPRSA